MQENTILPFPIAAVRTDDSGRVDAINPVGREFFSRLEMPVEVGNNLRAVLGDLEGRAWFLDDQGCCPVATLFEEAGKALATAFAPVARTGFKLERMETRMDFAIIGRRNNLSVVAKLLIQALGRGGEMFVIIPQSALSPMRQSLAHVLSSDGAGADPRWAQQMHAEVQRTRVSLEAILEERMITLGDVAQFQVGQVLELQANPKTPVRLQCNGQALFSCALGQSNGAYTLKIEEEIDQQQEFIDALHSH